MRRVCSGGPLLPLALILVLVLSAATTPAQAAPVPAHELSCLDDGALDAVRADPDAFTPLFRACLGELRDDLGPAFADLPRASLRLAFATIVAHHAAPYGDDPAPDRYDLQGLLHAPTLACDAFVALAWALGGGESPWAPSALAVGWDDGPVGNHAQLAVGSGADALLLDPTIGLVARVSYASVLARRPVATGAMVLFPRGDDAGTPTPELRQMTVDALYDGTLGTSTVLYAQRQ